MAWIILEVDANDERIDEVHDIRIVKNEDCEIAMFETLVEANEWLERKHKLHKLGLTYHTVEIWG